MTATDDATVSRVTSRDGTEIGYHTSGQGPPLVLVHGLLGDHTRWASLLPHLEPHVTVHAMDRRGRGSSGDSAEYDAAREFEDVAAVVDAVAAISGSPVDVLGSSGGASFAVAAATLTANIGRLVLFEPPTGAIAKLVPASLQQRLEALLAADDREAILDTAYRAVVGLSDAEIAHLRAQPAWPHRLAAAHTVPRELGIAAERLFDPQQAANVTAPTLVLVGGDTSDVFQASAETVAKTMPDARITVIDGQAHGAELFAPELVAGHVLAFLQGPS